MVKPITAPVAACATYKAKPILASFAKWNGCEVVTGASARTLRRPERFEKVAAGVRARDW